MYKAIGVLFVVSCLSFATFSSAELQHTSQSDPASPPTGQIVTVQAASTEDFINSIGVVTHFNYPSYKVGNLEALKSLLISSGIRHIRDSDFWPLPTFKSLAAQGIRVTWLADPALGVVPNRNYWCNPNGGPRNCYLLADFLKTQVGPNVFDAIETINEPDNFFGHYKWFAANPIALNGDKQNSYYWKNYALSLTKDTCSVLRGDPSLLYFKCIGPALGGTPDRFPPGSLYGIVDYGNMHPYPRAGNGATPASEYGKIGRYFQWGNSPALNIDEYPYAFKTYQPAFTGPYNRTIPMVATETGYCTGSAKMSISLTTHAKYMPRLFAEYFRHGILRTFSYEFYDEGENLANCEANFGLVKHDLAPKPAYTAISSLIKLLQDNGIPRKPGMLSYSMTVSPVGAYSRLQYVHDLLLQKSNGDFYLLLWHEISNAATSNGTQYSSTAVDVSPGPPALPVVFKFPPNVTSATLYSYAPNWTFNASEIILRNHELSVTASDAIKVILLHNDPRAPELRTPTVSSELR
jgi:hypothetical protein